MSHDRRNSRADGDSHSVASMTANRTKLVLIS